MTHALLSSILAMAALGGTTASGAVVLSQYTFGTDAAPTTSATTVDTTKTTATAITGVGVTATVNTTSTVGVTLVNGATAARPFLDVSNAGQTTIANAVANNDYFQFTLAPKTGYSLDLSNIVLDVANSGTTANRRFEVRYSFDDFATTPLVAGGTTFGTIGNRFDRVTYTLADQNALLDETSGTVTFRVYAAAGSDSGIVRFDNITVSGEVVPEPSTAGVLMAGLGVLASRRRRA